MESKFQLISYT